jgi:polyferredoxin
MGRLGYPAGLVRYSTQNAIDGLPSRVLRPRIVVYGVLLVTLLGAWAWGVAHRSPFIAEVLRDRNALYTLEGAQVENHYTLKIVNKTDAAARFRITLDGGPAGAHLSQEEAVDAAAGEVVSVPLEVTAPGARGRHGLHFRVESADGAVRRVDSSFFGPAP